MTNADLQIVIRAKDETASAFKGVGASLGSIAKYAGAAALAAGGMAIAFGISAVKSFEESEKVGAQLGAVLKSTAGAAGVTRDAAISLSQALQKQTTFSDEAVLGAENMLLTFTNIKDNVFPQATETVLNMATALGTDTRGAAIQLGKALNDPVRGINALRRVGVAFTEDQIKQIDTLVKSGKTMEAQKIILKELSTEFGGSAAAQADTFAGKIKQLDNIFDDFKEGIGQTIVGYLTPFLAKLTEIANNLPALAAQLGTFWSGFKAGIAGVFTDTNAYWVFVRDFFMPLFLTLKETLVAAWNDIRAAITPILPQLTVLAQFFGVVLVGAIMLAIGIIAEILTIVIKVSAGIIQMFGGAIKFLTGLFSIFFSAMLGDNEAVVQGFKDAWDGLKTFFSGLFKAIYAIVKPLIEPIINLINDVIDGYNKIPGKESIKKLSVGNEATGGSVMAHNAYMVGEQGRELFVPSQGGSILNARQTAKLGSGGGATTVNVTVQGNVDSDERIRQISDAVEKVLGRKQELTRMGAL